MTLRASTVNLLVPSERGALDLPSHPAEGLEASIMTASLMKGHNTLQLQIQKLQRSWLLW
jgi:hypothetical protein